MVSRPNTLPLPFRTPATQTSHRPEFVTKYGLLPPLLLSVLSLYRCFQSDSLLYLVFSLYSYWPVVFHPSVYIIPCALRLAYVRLKFDWKAEEMEGKRAVILSRMITHPAPQRVWYVLFICNNSAVSWFVRLVCKFFPFLIFSSFMLCVVLLTARLVYLPSTFGSFSYPRSLNVIA